MVFFTCSACGASLKKNQVEKHCSTKCRHCEYLTCIDCLKDFPGDSYIGHTKCVTENERYGGLNYVPKASQNKGEKKQMAWIENIQNLLSSSSVSDPNVKDLLKVIVKHENIPRKRAKFVNFVKNIHRKASPSTVDKTWSLFEEALKKKPSEDKQESKETKKNSSNKENGSNNDQTSSNKADVETENTKERKKKRKREEDEEAEPPAKVGKFDWDGVISAVLKKKNGSLSVKRLKKKVLLEYESQRIECHKSQVELSSKLDKKLKKNKKFKVLKDKVTLVS